MKLKKKYEPCLDIVVQSNTENMSKEGHGESPACIERHMAFYGKVIVVEKIKENLYLVL